MYLDSNYNFDAVDCLDVFYKDLLHTGSVLSRFLARSTLSLSFIALSDLSDPHGTPKARVFCELQDEWLWSYPTDTNLDEIVTGFFAQDEPTADGEAIGAVRASASLCWPELINPDFDSFHRDLGWWTTPHDAGRRSKHKSTN